MWWVVLASIVNWELLKRLYFILVNKMNDDE